jgi:hypothetical protein
MKKAARYPPGLLADVALLEAMAENLLDEFEHSVKSEDPLVWKRPLTKGNKTYYRWYCSWHDGKKTVRVYLGSCLKMSEAQALEKAKKIKQHAATSS